MRPQGRDGQRQQRAPALLVGAVLGAATAASAYLLASKLGPQKVVFATGSPAFGAAATKRQSKLGRAAAVDDLKALEHKRTVVVEEIAETTTLVLALKEKLGELRAAMHQIAMEGIPQARVAAAKELKIQLLVLLEQRAPESRIGALAAQLAALAGLPADLTASGLLEGKWAKLAGYGTTPEGKLLAHLITSDGRLEGETEGSPWSAGPTLQAQGTASGKNQWTVNHKSWTNSGIFGLGGSVDKIEDSYSVSELVYIDEDLRVEWMAGGDAQAVLYAYRKNVALTAAKIGFLESLEKKLG